MSNQFQLYRKHETEKLLHQLQHHDAWAVVPNCTLEAAPNVLRIARFATIVRKSVIMPKCAEENPHVAVTLQPRHLSVRWGPSNWPYPTFAVLPLQTQHHSLLFMSLPSMVQPVLKCFLTLVPTFQQLAKKSYTILMRMLTIFYLPKSSPWLLMEQKCTLLGNYPWHFN